MPPIDSEKDKVELVSGGKNVNGQFVPNDPNESLTSSSLAPQRDFNLDTNIAPSTAAQGELARFEQQTDQFTQNLTQQREQRESDTTTSLGEYLKSTLQTPGEIEQTTQAYAQEGGVDDIQTELNDINSQILGEQRALTNRLRALEKNPEGLFGGALEDEMRRVENESLQKQADLSVIQMSIQGRYQTAKEISDRAIAVRLEQDKRKNAALKEIFDFNRELFTTAEQREFDTMLSNRTRELDNEERQLTQISDLSLNALSNGAPQEIAMQMRQVKTVEQAFAIGGQYVDRLDRQYKLAQIQAIGYDNLLAQAKLLEFENQPVGGLSDEQIKNIDNSPQGKRLVTASDLKLKLSSYQDLVKQYGFEQAGVEKAVLQNAYKELQLAYKEAANLGVLNGPDLTIVEEAIGSATPGFIGNTLNVFTLGGGTRKLIANLEQAQTTLNNSAQLNAEQLYARDPDYKNSMYVQSILLPFGDELLTTVDINEMDAILNTP